MSTAKKTRRVRRIGAALSVASLVVLLAGCDDHTETDPGTVSGANRDYITVRYNEANNRQTNHTWYGQSKATMRNCKVGDPWPKCKG
jgi:hypothetical protein